MKPTRTGGGELPKHPIEEYRVFWAAMLLEKKDLAVVKLGVARSEIGALSGARMDDRVALETWSRDGEIANLT